MSTPTPPPAEQHFPDGGGRVHAGSREGCWLCDPTAGGVGSGEPTEEAPKRDIADEALYPHERGCRALYEQQLGVDTCRCSRRFFLALVDEVGRLRNALSALVGLKDGPHDDTYRALKDAAWQQARDVLGVDHV